MQIAHEAIRTKTDGHDSASNWPLKNNEPVQHDYQKAVHQNKTTSLAYRTYCHAPILGYKEQRSDILNRQLFSVH